MSRQVVFGTGQVGRHLLDQLVRVGHDAIGVNRSGHSPVPGATAVAGDATDPEFTTKVTRGADVVYFCLNATRYEHWAEEFPPLQRGVVAGAQASGARLVVLDNLYGYAPPADGVLRETTRVSPSSTKAAVRVAMTEELLSAHRNGRIQVAIGRASDYFGPGTTQSALGAGVFEAASVGRACWLMGNPDRLHSYSYTPDVARALLAFGTAPDAVGEVWHLPIGQTRTTREVVAEVYRLAGHRPRIGSVGEWRLRLIGTVQPALREYRHTLYQFSQPWLVDDDKFRTAFGDLATPQSEALATTLAWFRSAAASQPQPTPPGDRPSITAQRERNRP